MTKIRFWGVRGSVPAPLTGLEIKTKIISAVEQYRSAGCPKDLIGFFADQGLDNYTRKKTSTIWSTYGGNTSCVEVISDGVRFVLDMGTGIRLLGNSLIPEMLKERHLEIVFLLSHLHWDHIQGLPFFAPLYTNKQTGVLNTWRFYGGTNWQKTAETCMQGQMNPPLFPVSWAEIQKMTHEIFSTDVYDQMSFRPVPNGPMVTCRKLNHPQETYGWRITDSERKVIVYTTDNEPFDPRIPDPRLLSLVKDAHLWVTDCQYTRNQYNGVTDGVPRHGWGHSYPEAVAETALLANVKQVVLFHHDPTSSDAKIKAIEEHTQALVNVGIPIEVIAASEELEINV